MQPDIASSTNDSKAQEAKAAQVKENLALKEEKQPYHKSPTGDQT